MEYKLVLLGLSTVGKSSLIDRFMGHSFSKEYFPTIKRTYRKVLQMEGEDCLLEIIDSSGDPIFSQVTEYQIRRGDGFIIIFAVDNLDSFEVAKDNIKKVCLVKDTHSPCIVLVASKCELERKVDLNSAISLAQSYSAPYIETSSRLCSHVGEVFYYATSMARKKEITEKQDSPDDVGQSCCNIM